MQEENLLIYYILLIDADRIWEGRISDIIKHKEANLRIMFGCT